MLRMLLRVLKWTLGLLFGAIAVFALVMFVCSRWTTNPESVTCTNEKHTVHIASSGNGVHLGFVLPLAEVPAHHFEAVPATDSTQFFAYGWGDRAFYIHVPTWDKLDYGIAAKSLLMNTSSAMHVFRHQHFREEWKTLQLCEKQFTQLLDFLDQSFEKNDQGEWQSIPLEGYTANDFLFASPANYNAIHTCNNWANDGLKAADVKTAIWAPMAFGVARHL